MTSVALPLEAQKLTTHYLLSNISPVSVLIDCVVIADKCDSIIEAIFEPIPGVAAISSTLALRIAATEPNRSNSEALRAAQVVESHPKSTPALPLIDVIDGR